MYLFKPEPRLTGLPDEVLVHILAWLSSGSDIFNISLTCIRLQKLAVDQRILRRLDLDPSFTIEALIFSSRIRP